MPAELADVDQGYSLFIAEHTFTRHARDSGHLFDGGRKYPLSRA
jgi:hypothetical protein